MRKKLKRRPWPISLSFYRVTKYLFTLNYSLRKTILIIQFSIGFENLEKIVVKSSNAMCVHQNLIHMFCCKCIHLVEDGQTHKLLHYGYVQCNMQFWSLQGTFCTVQCSGGRTHNFYYFQHQHVSLLQHWTLSRGWKFEPISRCQVI